MGKIKIKQTERNFPIGNFKDRYDTECSIQKSSLAFEDCIWLGVNNANPKILIPNEGWKPFYIPEEVLLTTRMHLTQKQVKELLPILQKFVETGDII